MERLLTLLLCAGFFYLMMRYGCGAQMVPSTPSCCPLELVAFIRRWPRLSSEELKLVQELAGASRSQEKDAPVKTHRHGLRGKTYTH
jgi:hypothetical protein